MLKKFDEFINESLYDENDGWTTTSTLDVDYSIKVEESVNLIINKYEKNETKRGIFFNCKKDIQEDIIKKLLKDKRREIIIDIIYDTYDCENLIKKIQEDYDDTFLNGIHIITDEKFLSRNLSSQIKDLLKNNSDFRGLFIVFSDKKMESDFSDFKLHHLFNIFFDSVKLQ